MYKSTFTQDCVAYIESQGKTVSEDYAAKLDNVLLVCERITNEGQKDAQEGHPQKTITDFLERIQRAAVCFDSSQRAVQNAADTLFAYYDLGYQAAKQGG